MSQMIDDLRAALCSLKSKPGVVVAVLLTLAIAVGINTTVFSIIDSVLLHPLPFADAHRLVYLDYVNQEKDITVAPPLELVQVLRDDATGVEQIETYHDQSLRLEINNKWVQLDGAWVSPRFFSFLGAQPQLGQLSRSETAGSANHQVVVLSHQAWETHFNLDPGALNRELVINGQSFQIIAVLPSWFHVDKFTAADIWIPSPEENLSPETRVGSIARLKSGTTLDAVNAQLEAISKALHLSNSDLPEGDWIARAQEPGSPFGPKGHKALLVLQVAVFLVLLVAVANITNLLLARGESREKEMAIRSALGAGRKRLLRQLLLESLVLASVGGALGFLLSMWASDLLRALHPDTLYYLSWLRVSPSQTSFTVLVTVGVAFLFGLVPALHGSRANISSILKQSLTSSEGLPYRNVLRRSLVTVEVTLSITLMIGAAVLLRAFWDLSHQDPGYAPENLLSFRLELSETFEENPDRLIAMFDQLAEELDATLGSSAQSFAVGSGHYPHTMAGFGKPEIEGQAEVIQTPQLLAYIAASESYFETLGITLVDGRSFSRHDDQNSEPVVIINETLARRTLPNESVLDRRIRFTNRWYRVVGVAEDALHWGLAPSRYGKEQVYFPIRQMPASGVNLFIRNRENQTDVIGLTRSVCKRLFPEQPLTEITTARELLAKSLAQERFNTSLMTLFAVIAQLLMAIGIYGVVAYTVSQQTRAIGIRLALGARRQDILVELIRNNLVPVGTGIVLGLGCAVVLCRALASVLSAVDANDVIVYILVTTVVIAVSLLAIFFPARKASWVDPMNMLRPE